MKEKVSKIRRALELADGCCHHDGVEDAIEFLNENGKPCDKTMTYGYIQTLLYEYAREEITDFDDNLHKVYQRAI